MSPRMASTSFAMPRPFNTTFTPWAASDLAMPRPIPLVEPVTIAPLSFKLVANTVSFLLGFLARAIGAVDIVGDGHSRRRAIETAGIRERAPNDIEATLPMLTHGIGP